MGGFSYKRIMGLVNSIIYGTFPQPLLHPSPVEHGGVSQRSSLPQQVVPGTCPLSLKRIEGADISFSRSELPQFLHRGRLSPEPGAVNISDT